MFKLIVFLALSLSAVAQECSTPQTSNLPNGAITVTYNCLTVSPGQNSPYTRSETVVASVDGTRVFSSVSLSYQGGYLIYGNPASMTTVVSLPDVHNPGVDLLAFTVTGSGSSFQQSAVAVWTLNPAVDTFRIRQDISQTGNIVANCYAYCGYSLVITLNP